MLQRGVGAFRAGTRGVLVREKASPAWSLAKKSPQDWLSYLLPANYPSSVTPRYMRFASWQFAGSALSAANGVLSTQALLFAVGLGVETAIPAAAALNWVLKDGLGQLGGVVAAGVVSNRFDSHSKRWRLRSAAILDVSTGLEVMSPLFPSMFLLLATVANVGKNVAWLSASATRASIHKSFLRAENLADVTAKAGAQVTTASLVGTALGIGLSALLGPDPLTLLPLFGALSMGHLACTYVSVRQVTMRTLNEERGAVLARAFVEGRPLPTPDEVREDEQVVVAQSGPRVLIGVPLDEAATSMDEVKDAQRACKGENFLLFRDGSTAHVIITEGATPDDVLCAFLVAWRAAALHNEAADVHEHVQWLNKDGRKERWIKELRDKAWIVGDCSTLEHTQMRLVVR